MLKQTDFNYCVGIHLNNDVDSENLGLHGMPVPFSQYQPLYHGESN